MNWQLWLVAAWFAVQLVTQPYVLSRPRAAYTPVELSMALAEIVAVFALFAWGVTS